MRAVAAGLLLVICAACTADVRETPAERGELPLWVRSTTEPYPFTTPIPPLEETPIDGTYARRVGAEVAGTSVPCRRCAPYRLEAGRTTLRFEHGRYLVSHRAPGQPGSSQFTSRGHYVIERPHIVLFNDANCSKVRGRYRWSLRGRLVLEAVSDPCPFSRLRRRFLTATSWEVQG